jgi:hypothetical protein
MGSVRSTNVEESNAYQILVVKREGKNLLGRPRRMWVDIIEMYLGQRGWGGVD